MKEKELRVDKGEKISDGTDDNARLERRYRDKRYQRTERAIDEVFFKTWPRVKMIELAKKARISRSTLYRHHRSLAEILPDLEKRTLDEFREKIVEVSLIRRLKLRVIFYQMLTFVRRNRQEFEVIVKKKDVKVLDEMVAELLPQVEQKYHWPRSYREMILVYEREITAVVESWILDDFRESRMEVLGDIMYLTRTVRKYLMPLGH